MEDSGKKSINIDKIDSAQIPISCKEVATISNNRKTYLDYFGDISDYIPNITKYKEPVKIPSIDLVSFRKTGRTYEIGSNLFSIQKILRLLSTGNDLYTSIFSGVNLTEEEYNAVLKALNCYETTK